MVGVGSKRKVSDQENVEDVEENAEMELEDGTESKYSAQNCMPYNRLGLRPP
jgi:hypothetical protein